MSGWKYNWHHEKQHFELEVRKKTNFRGICSMLWITMKQTLPQTILIKSCVLCSFWTLPVQCTNSQFLFHIRHYLTFIRIHSDIQVAFTFKGRRAADAQHVVFLLSACTIYSGQAAQMNRKVTIWIFFLWWLQKPHIFI